MAKKPTKAASEGGQAPGADASAQAGAPYVVLARKYRPATFEDLIG